MSSEVYRVKLQLLQASKKLQVRVSILVQLSACLQTTTPIRLKLSSSITDVSSGLDVMGNATLASIASSGTAQYEQTELGGTAVGRKIETTVDSAWLAQEHLTFTSTSHHEPDTYESRP